MPPPKAPTLYILCPLPGKLGRGAPRRKGHVPELPPSHSEVNEDPNNRRGPHNPSHAWLYDPFPGEP